MRKGRRKRSLIDEDLMSKLVQLATIIAVIYGAGPGHK